MGKFAKSRAHGRAAPSGSSNPPRPAAHSGSRGARNPSRPTAEGWAWLCTLGLCAALLTSGTLVAPTAAASFDAAKRLGLAFSIALAALGGTATWLVSWGEPSHLSVRGWTRRAKLGALAYLAAWVLAGFSTLTAVNPAASLDTFRYLSLCILLVPLGASSALNPRRSRAVAGSALAACGLNAGLALMQAWAGIELFTMTGLGGRSNAVGLLGNEGYVALGAALAAVACVAIGLTTTSKSIRISVVSCAAICIAAALSLASLTATLSLMAGAAVVLPLRLGRRSLTRLSAATALLLVTIGLLPGTRLRLVHLVSDLGRGNWNAVLTARLGPWAAALEMIRENPALGVGPGGFGSAFAGAKVAAEMRHHTRFLTTDLVGGFSQAHNDLLQAMAELGIPAGLCFTLGFAACISQAIRAARRSPPEQAPQALLLAGVLTAGAVASLTWFPFQIPLTGVILALALGRCLRLDAQDFPNLGGSPAEALP